MFETATIEALIGRIGWAPAIPPSDITVEASNASASSGRYFNSFHMLVTVENVDQTIPNIDANSGDFNVYLAQRRKDGVLAVLDRVFVTNDRATRPYTDAFVSLNYAKDYNPLIVNNTPSGLFDEAIGLAVAIKMVQLFLTTPRSNSDERVLGMTYSKLKGELNGFFNERGILIADGLVQGYEAAIVRIIEVLFPIEKRETPRISSFNGW